jgi:hypothetical protein
VVRPSRTSTAAETRAYLEELPVLWATTSDAGRHAIAEAVFERIDVLGVTDYTFTLTAHAKARGWDAAFGAGVARVKDREFGRGERTCPDQTGTSPIPTLASARSRRRRSRGPATERPS